MVAIDLVYNLTLLVALSVVSGFVADRWQGKPQAGVLQGLVFGTAAVIGMLRPFVLSEGIIFDGRSVVLSLGAFFFGPVTAFVASAMAITCRVLQGGAGALTGVLVILAAACIGVYYHRRRPPQTTGPGWAFFVKLGIVVQAAMLLLMLTLPDGRGWDVLRQMGLPILITYSIATVLIGRILADQQSRHGMVGQLRAGLEELRTTLYSIGDAVITTDRESRVVRMNPVAEALTGWRETEARGLTSSAVFRIINEETRDAVESPIARVLEAGVVVGLANHTLLIARDGTERPIADSGAPIRGADDAITGVVLVFRDQTQERAAEAALRQEMRRLEMAEARARLGSWEFEVGTGEGWWSRQMYALFGVESGNGLPPIEVYLERIHPDDRAQVEDALARMMQGERPAPMRYRSNPALGPLRVFSPTVDCEYGPDGAVTRFVGTVLDVTESELAQEALRASEERFRIAIENSPVIVFSQDAELRYTWIYNPNAGFTADGVIGKTDADLLVPSDATHLMDLKRRVMDTGQAAREEVRTTIDGTVYYYDLTVEPLRLGDGTIAGVICASVDITDRKQTADALQVQARQQAAVARLGQMALRERDLTAFWQAAVAIVAETLDVEYCKMLELLPGGTELKLVAGVGWNPGAAESATVPADAHSQAGFTLVSDAPVVVADLRNETRFTGPELLTSHHVVSGLSVVIDGVTKPWGVLGAHSTRRRAFSDDDVHFVESVAHVIAEATTRRQAELERMQLESQLRQSQKMEAVGRLAGGIAHDFNNMLTIILGHADLVAEQLASDEAVYEDVQEIIRAGRRSAELTRQLLGFARKQTIAPKALDLNDTVAGMLKMLRRVIGEHIELDWRPAKTQCPVFMDPAQLDQILVNLLVNARDAIQGTGRVSIETGEVYLDDEYCDVHAGFAPGHYVVLTVSDTGCGMGPDVMAHIFEPFYTTKHQGEGSGLGLATVYGIVRQNEGQINVYSTPGKGTTFRIYLPLSNGEAIPAEQEVQSSPPEGSETILLVEDEESLLRIVERQLHQLGYTVLKAHAPETALTIAQAYEGRIDILLTDILMPGMSGRELAEKVTALRPEVKCLFMSGYSANIFEHQDLPRDAFFLQKPFTRNVLALRIRDALGA